MPTPVLDVRTPQTARLAIARAAEVLRGGGLVAFPTETVYGLGANALDPEAVARIFEAKGRPANNPLIVHVATVAGAQELVATWPDDADRLAARFWPGPLTLVLPRSALVPDIITAGGPTLAVRMPNHDVVRELITTAGVPLAAPSANRSGSLSPTTAEHVKADLDGRIELILDSGPTTGGIESTVLDVTRRPARLLRPGLVTPGEIESLIGPIVHPAATSETTTAALPSPGMLTRHYAPRTPLEIVEGDPWPRLAELARLGVNACLLARNADISLPSPIAVRLVALGDDPEEVASRLYVLLHDLDQRGLDRLVVRMPPDTEEWLAVRDRLRRAAAPA
jgi:L-threonylcarbamoyladenylate synthase